MKQPNLNQKDHVDNKTEATVNNELLEIAGLEADAVLKLLKTQSTGLSEGEASSRIKQTGLNEIAREKRQSVLMHLLSNLKNPLVILLAVLAAISYLTGDIRATIIISLMVLLGVVLRFSQELRADHAAEKIKAMVSNKATVIRDSQEKEIPLKMLVPGDIVRLSAGDMTPADVRLLSVKDLFLNQVALTGEALPVEKLAGPAPKDVLNPLEIGNLCFFRLKHRERHRFGCCHPYRRKNSLWFSGSQSSRPTDLDQF